jgi:hypothetical protein
MASDRADMAELWSFALDRGYICGEIENTGGEDDWGDGPIILFDIASRVVVGFGMTPAQAIAHIQESSGPSKGPGRVGVNPFEAKRGR